MDSFHGGHVVAGKYRLQRLIAEGGMGEIWQAHHLQLDAPVAVKFMDPTLVASPAARERFAREARAAAKIQSPHVVHISDHGLDGDTPYIVMELMEGEDLDSRLMRGSLPLDVAEQVVVQASRGLRKAHEAGIVHRDLKPANLFLSGDSDEWILKIVDFGVAKARGAHALPPMPPSNPGRGRGQADFTQTGIVLGSPQYMSPEQARGFKDVDHRADVWALASIMFRALTGRRLYENLSAYEALAQLVHKKPPVPSELVPGLPAPLGAFFDRALHRDQGQRFDSARELAKAFSAAVAQVKKSADQSSITGATVSNAPPSMPLLSTPPPTSPARTSRPARWAMLGGALVLVTAVSVAALMLGRSEGPAMQATEGLSRLVVLDEDADSEPATRGEAAEVEVDPAASSSAAPSKAGRWRPPPKKAPGKPKRSWGF
jgi:serine/threonine-protein kinase